jgi:hypothetical protein
MIAKGCETAAWYLTQYLVLEAKPPGWSATPLKKNKGPSRIDRSSFLLHATMVCCWPL